VGRFAAGLVVGLLAGGALGAGGMWLLRRPAPAPVAVTPPAAPERPTPPSPHTRRRSPRAAAGATTDETITLSAADQQMTSAGDSLRAETTLDMSQTEARDLTSDEIDGAVGRRSDAIIACLRDARGAAPLAGRVVVGMVVDASGRVTRTRVEAPAYLVKHGLYDCARRAVADLRFPAVGRSTVVSVPFTITSE
jgi:hypothetical protein